APTGGQRRDLEVVGERLQGRDVRHSRPPAIRIGADNADTNPLVSILARGGHTLFLETTPSRSMTSCKVYWTKRFSLSVSPTRQNLLSRRIDRLTDYAHKSDIPNLAG